MRPSRNEVLMDHARLVSTRGTCARLKVGALIHRDGRILVTGYNGAPAGLPHCDHECNCEWQGVPDAKTQVPLHEYDCNTNAPCETAAHAERNCIDWAARHGIRLEGAEMVTTDTPCGVCAGSIINAGLRSVVSLREYRLTEGVEMLHAAGVICSLYKDVR